MKDIKKIIGKTIKDIEYDGDIFNIEDDELLREIKLELFDSGFMKHLNSLDNGDKQKQKTLDEEFNILAKSMNEYYKTHPVEILSANTVCDKCPNNIKNGGSGICNCTLNLPEIR